MGLFLLVLMVALKTKARQYSPWPGISRSLKLNDICMNFPFRQGGHKARIIARLNDIKCPKQFVKEHSFLMPSVFREVPELFIHFGFDEGKMNGNNLDETK